MRPAEIRRPIRARLPELDILRGVAILAVVYLHSYFRTWPEVTEGERLTLLISHLFAHGAVPVFLFISGFLLARDHSPSFSAFLAGRLRRVALPGVVWMAVALGYEAWWAGGLSAPLWRRFILFDIEGQFYFLIVLAMLMAGAYPLRHASTRTVASVTGVAFLIGLGTIAWYEQQQIGGDFAVFAYRNPAIWAYFFLFGLLADRLRGDVLWGHAVEGAAAAGMTATFVAYVWQGETRGYPTSYFGVTVYLFSSLGLVVYPAVARWTVQTPAGRLLTRPFAWLAPLSFGIFLVHKPYFLGWMSSTLLEGTRFEHSWSQLVFANFVLGAVASIAFVWAVDRVWPSAGRLLLGVDRPRPRKGQVVEPAKRAA
ncbi:MAG: acyltransferase [Dehalococcoidia bacterium]|nr:MAG: acyltransferase [Dehalococcoidia bacterium]